MVTMTDIRVWPFPDWDADGNCVISIDRLTVRTAAVDEADVVRLKAQASGASAPASCLPPEAQQGTQMLGVDKVSLSRLTFDIDYRISTAAATAHVYGRADDLAAVTASADFSYFWFDGREDMDNPKPVAILREARLTVENLGVWDKVRPMVPPPFTDPASAGAAIEAVLAEALPPFPPGAPADAAATLRETARDGWLAFLADPKALVLETGFDPEAPVFLDAAVLEEQPEEALGYLQPVVAVTSARARATLPVALLQQAADTPDTLSDDERLTTGLALASGSGAPRDLSGARTLLEPLAAAGNGAAAAGLARALEARDPAAAYSHALVAAASGETQAGALLDRIEAALPFATVLDLQAERVAGVEHPASALGDIASVRAQAAMRMTGRGETRSYATAALWSMIGAAAGDAESGDILEEIDERVRLAGPEAAATWAAQEASAVNLARSAWISFDLPATFAGGN
jgi:TPR repeat protein